MPTGAVAAYDKLFLLSPESRSRTRILPGAARSAMLQAKQYSALLRQLDAVAAAGPVPRPPGPRTCAATSNWPRTTSSWLPWTICARRSSSRMSAIRPSRAKPCYKAAAALEQMKDPRAKEMYKKVVTDWGASPYAAQAKGKI